jgi:hypothetical protein
MIDMDGQVQLAADNDKVAAPASDGANVQPMEAAFEATAVQDSLISPAEPASSFEAFAEQSVEHQNEIMDEAPGSSTENANWFEQGLDQPPPEVPQAIASTPSGDFSDISDFGNKDADAGALQFDLTLSGIDHKEMRAEVLDVLADPRLFLNLRDLPVKNGTILLPGLNAARTSLIVTRLQHLNLRINWKQRLYEA